MKKLLSMLLIGAMTITLVFSLSACSGGKTMDLNKYFGFKFNGLNTIGKAEVEFDRDTFNADFEEAYKGQIAKWDKEGLQGELKKEAVSSCFDWELDKEDNLSNGDKVVLTISIDEASCEELGVKFKTSPIDVEVIGLKDGKQVDAFEGINVQFSGISPSAKATLNKTTNNDNGFAITYSLDKAENLKIGDKVIVSAEFDYNAAVEAECVVKETEKEFTVEGVPQQIQGADDISGNKLDNVRKEADAMAKEYYEGRKIKDSFMNKAYVSMYNSYFNDFGKAKSVSNQKAEKTYLYTDPNDGSNILIFRYTFDVNDINGENFKNAFSFIYVNAPYIDTDGTVKYSDMGYSAYAFTSEAEYEEYLQKITTGNKEFNLTKTEIK